MERGMDHKYYYRPWTHRCTHAHKHTWSKGKSNQRMSPVTASEPNDTFPGQINRTRQATGKPVTHSPSTVQRQCDMDGWLPSETWLILPSAGTHMLPAPEMLCVRSKWATTKTERKTGPFGRAVKLLMPSTFVLRRAREGEWNEDTQIGKMTAPSFAAAAFLYSASGLLAPCHAWPHHHQLSKRYVRNRVQPIFHTRKSFPFFFLLACLSQVLKPSVRFGAFDWGWDGAGILDVQMCAIYYEGQECFYRFFCVFCLLYAFFAKLV